MRPMHGPWMRAGRDEDFDDAHVDRALVRRVWAYGRPYKRKLVLFLVAVVGGALVMTVPPLLFRSIVDDAIPNHDRSLAMVLAITAIGVAVVNTALGVAERWFSS